MWIGFILMTFPPFIFLPPFPPSMLTFLMIPFTKGVSLDTRVCLLCTCLATTSWLRTEVSDYIPANSQLSQGFLWSYLDNPVSYCTLCCFFFPLLKAKCLTVFILSSTKLHLHWPTKIVHSGKDFNLLTATKSEKECGIWCLLGSSHIWTLSWAPGCILTLRGTC